MTEPDSEREQRRRMKAEMHLEWDFVAGPIWEGGNPVNHDEFVKDPTLKAELLAWYKKFSEAEEVLHSNNERPNVGEAGKAIGDLKGLILEGEDLARRVGVKGLIVDYGHDPRLREIEFRLLGEREDLTEFWDERERRERDNGT